MRSEFLNRHKHATNSSDCMLESAIQNTHLQSGSSSMHDCTSVVQCLTSDSSTELSHLSPWCLICLPCDSSQADPLPLLTILIISFSLVRHQDRQNNTHPQISIVPREQTKNAVSVRKIQLHAQIRSWAKRGSRENTWISKESCVTAMRTQRNSRRAFPNDSKSASKAVKDSISSQKAQRESGFSGISFDWRQPCGLSVCKSGNQKAERTGPFKCRMRQVSTCAWE